MASVVYLDTHVVAWLFAGRLDLLPARSLKLMEDCDLLVSPMVTLELQYLFETGRSSEPSGTVHGALAAEVGLRVCDLPFEKVVGAALKLEWTRDPFDRLIVGQAAVRAAPLVTKDKEILKNFSLAKWK